MKIFTKTVELSKAQIEALHTTPVDVVAAANVGYAVIPVAAQLWKTAGASATSADSDVSLIYQGASSAIITFEDADGTGALETAAGTVQFGAVQALIATAAANKKIQITASEAITCAAGTVAKVSVDFKIVKL